MALLIEDGSNVPGAQTYVSESTLTAYALARGYTLVGDPSQLLLQAMDWVENLNFQGIRGYYIQTLQWPRLRIMIDLYWVMNNTIPQLLKDLECEVAMAIDMGESPYASIPNKITRVKAGSIEIDYLGASVSNPINRAILNKIRKLVVGGGGFSTVRA